VKLLGHQKSRHVFELQNLKNFDEAVRQEEKKAEGERKGGEGIKRGKSSATV
jgi:hypothetical protein